MTLASATVLYVPSALEHQKPVVRGQAVPLTKRSFLMPREQTGEFLDCVHRTDRT